MKTKIMFLLVVVLISFQTYKEIAAQPPTPKIDCNGSITCIGAEPWQEINNEGFVYNGCIITPKFKFSKCCTGSVCEYMVDIESIQVKGLCGLSVDEIKKEALKYIMATLPKIANIEIYSSFQLHVKIPKCMTYNESNFFMITLTNMYPCQPEDCCLAQYEIVTEWDRVRVVSQTAYVNNFITCTETGGVNCQYSCDALDFTP